MEAAQSKTVARAAAPAPVPTPAAQPVRIAVPSGHVQLQSLKVSSPSDPAEKEAEATARKVVRLPASPQSPHVARFQNAIARKAEGQPNVASNVAEISASTASGSPLPASVRRFMEPRFRADFGNVRVHTGERAARLNRQVSAQAFTVGNQIFFGRGKFQPETSEGRELLAHELTHTIQQGAVQQGAATVQRSADVTVSEQSPPQVQRLGLSDALDYFADKANLIPGFRMFTVILGVNPINMSRVERSAANILRAVIEIIPGGALITQALDNHGVFDRVGTWVEQQIRTLGMTGSLIRDAIDRFLDSLSWTDIFDLGGVWDRAKRIFTEPIDRIFSFVTGLVSGILGFIKDAILRPLARLAEGTRGYDLLKAVLGQDPVTGDPYPRNAETLIGGFMRLIGQEEIWQNIQRSGAVARAWAWFQGALSGLLGFVRQIPSLFLQAFRSLELADIILLPRAFAKIASVFGGFIGQFLSWAGNTVWSLLEIIFSVVAPNVMVYLRRAAGAFRTILRNPIGFVGNLVRAGILGLRQFASRFLTHLRASLIGWLTGAMSGANIYIPQGFNLREIIKFVLSVLGLTWQNIRQKLVRVIGEPAVRVLETGFDIVMTLVTQGPAAAWEKIQESLSNLRDLVMEQIMTFVRDRIVQAAITRLVTSLNPAGAFIQAVIAIYNTVMFFVERLRQIAQVAMSFIDSISAIASGALGAAANRVEQTMAGLLTLVISFLARIVGLGRVSDAVTNVIDKVRQPIDKALDRVVEWIVAQARKLGRLAVGAARSAAERVIGWWRARKGFKAANGAAHTLAFAGQPESAVLVVRSTERPLTVYVETLQRKGITIPPATLQIIAETQDKIREFRTRIVVHTDGTRTERLAQPGLDSGSKVAKLLEDLAKALATLPDPEGNPLESLVVPETQPLPPTIRTITAGLKTPSKEAEQVEIHPLSIRPGKLAGSAASLYSSLYKEVSQRKGTYVAGHILSSFAHGPGNQSWNLAIITTSANRKMSGGVEKEIHRLLFEENEVLRYKVKVDYPDGSAPGPHIPAESLLPTLISFELEVLKVKESALKSAGSSPDALNAVRKLAGNWEPKRKIAIADVRSEPPLKTPCDVQDLNTTSRPQIEGKGINQSFAEALAKVAKERRFEDRADLESRLSQAATTGELMLLRPESFKQENRDRLTTYLGANAAEFFSAAKHSKKGLADHLVGKVDQKFARFVQPLALRANGDVAQLLALLEQELPRADFLRYGDSQDLINKHAQVLFSKLQAGALTWKE